VRLKARVVFPQHNAPDLRREDVEVYPAIADQSNARSWGILAVPILVVQIAVASRDAPRVQLHYPLKI
jgi:hypothetical protein